MSSDNKEDNSMGIVIEQSVNDFDGTKSSVEPDLGDDQAFPFIPGFGKNSGKDWLSFLHYSLNYTKKIYMHLNPRPLLMINYKHSKIFTAGDFFVVTVKN